MNIYCKHDWQTTQGLWDRDNYVVARYYPKCKICGTIWDKDASEPEVIIGFIK